MMTSETSIQHCALSLSLCVCVCVCVCVTQGDPKAIIWDHITPLRAGADGWAHQDIRPAQRVCWPTSLGWMMGPWLLYATLLNGACVTLYHVSERMICHTAAPGQSHTLFQLRPTLSCAGGMCGVTLDQWALRHSRFTGRLCDTLCVCVTCVCLCVQGAPLGKDFGVFVQTAGVNVLGLVPSIVKAWRHTQCMKVNVRLEWATHTHS